MSHLANSTEYGANYQKMSSVNLPTEEQTKYEKVEVAFSKDSNGNVLDKKCLVFYVAGGNGRRKYGQLDMNSKLNVGDTVDIASVQEIALSNGQQTIYRYDGEAI